MKILKGCVPWILASKPDAHYHCCVTSPPYWCLRDYGGEPSDWPAVSYAPMAGLPPVEVPAMRCALGLEKTPEAFIGHLVLVFRAVRRVLRDDGTLWLNLGDSFNGAGSSGSLETSSLKLGGADARRDVRANRSKTKSTAAPGLKPKDLVGIPWRAAMALQADGWYLRSEVVWSKPNPMPESVTDRPTKAHEQVFLLTKAPRYFYDAEAVREPLVKGAAGSRFDRGKTGTNGMGRVQEGEREDNPAGRNLRTVWTIATRPSRVSHFAVMAPALAERCIKAGTSEHGCCSACGAPWARVVEREGLPRERSGSHNNVPGREGGGISGMTNLSGAKLAAWKAAHPDKHLGWRPTCPCAASIAPCRVLDPFGGSGTTAAVAAVLGRVGTLCEPNEGYRALVEARADEVRRSMERRAAKTLQRYIEPRKTGRPPGRD